MSLGKGLAAAHRIRLGQYKSCIFDKNSKVQEVCWSVPKSLRDNEVIQGTFTVHLKQGSKSRFCKPRTVLFAIKDAVGKALYPLEKADRVIKENYCEWAASIVLIPKWDGSILVCGDFKVIINPFINVDQYPLPKLTDLMTCLTGGKIFRKLDSLQHINKCCWMTTQVSWLL